MPPKVNLLHALSQAQRTGQDHEAGFKALKGAQPLTLLPVRLETRFVDAEGNAPRRLRIRIYPDTLHVDAHRRGLNAAEQALGRDFWSRHEASEGAENKEACWQDLVTSLGARRAAWVARQTRPGGSSSLTLSEAPYRARARLLPDRWVAIGFRKDGEPLFTRWSAEVDRQLALAPDPSSFGLAEDAAGLSQAEQVRKGIHRDPALSWMIHWETALKKGMAIQVGLKGDLAPIWKRGLGGLMVLGVRGGRKAGGEAKALIHQLEACHYTHGLALPPRGVPTNNTAEARSGWQGRHPDPRTLYRREVLEKRSAPEGASVSDRLTRILGLKHAQIDAGVLERIPGADRPVDQGEAAMNSLLWPVSWGALMEDLLNPEQGPATFSPNTVSKVRSFFINQVRGGGHLPVLRVGDQPYGLLPVKTFTAPPSIRGPIDGLRELLAKLWDWWAAATPTVPRLDPDAADAPGGGEDDDARLREAEERLLSVLTNQPHPARLWPHTLHDRRTGLRGVVFAYETIFVVLRFLPQTELSGLEAMARYTVDARATSIDSQVSGARTFASWTVGEIDRRKTEGVHAFVAIQEAINGVCAALLKISTVSSAQGTIQDVTAGTWRLIARVNARTIVWDAEVDDLGVSRPTVTFTDADTGKTFTSFESLVKDYTGHYRDHARYNADTLQADLAWAELSKVTTANVKYLDNLEAFEALEAIKPATIDKLVTLLEAHQTRLAPLRALGLDDIETRVGERWYCPRVATMLYAEDEREVEDRPHWEGALVDATDDEPLHRASGYLAQLRKDLHAAIGHGRPFDSMYFNSLDAARPLLAQLLNNALRQAPYAQHPELLAALDRLLALSVSELEERLIETLGLATHRLDAWITPFAWFNLDKARDLRRGGRTGAQLGAYGWVEGLRRSEAPISQGFLHAPTPTHATTAAILRAGWSALGSEQPDSPAAVNLSTRRTRGASWILNGVRRGRELGELLGYRAERLLHEAGLDRFVAPLREVVPGDGGLDGLTLARLWSEEDGDLSEAEIVKHRDERLFPTLGGRGGVLPKLRGALNRLADELDAVVDLSLAEGVHSLVQGRLERAGAVMASISDGELPPPERFEVLETPREGLTVSHRLMLMLPASSTASAPWPGTERSGVARMVPAVEAWLCGLLGPASGIRLRAQADQDPPVEFDLSQADLAAVDLVTLAPDGALGARSALARRLVDALRRGPMSELAPGARVKLLPERWQDLDADALSLDEALPMLRALRQVLAVGRDLQPADLSVGEERDPELDALYATFSALHTELRDLHQRLRQELAPAMPEEDEPLDTDKVRPAKLRKILGELATLGLPGATPQAGWSSRTGPEGQAERARLFKQAGRVTRSTKAMTQTLRRHRRALEEAHGSFEQAPTRAQRAYLEGGFRALLGELITPMSTCVAPNGRALGEAFSRPRAPLDTDPRAASTWLHQVARVRPSVARLAWAVDACEATLDRSLAPLSVAQLPDLEGEGWAALTRPSTDRGARTSLVAWAPAGLDLDKPVVGLLIDEWSERIPDPEATTGLSFHYDAPTARAPQAILLLTPEADGHTLSSVVDAVWQTLRMARMRAVGVEDLIETEDLPGLGHFLPALFTQRNLRAPEEAE